MSSCRTNRARLAPIARRTAISCCRTAARASSRFATFEHAISNTMPTTTRSPMPANRIGVDLPLAFAKSASRIGRTVAV